MQATSGDSSGGTLEGDRVKFVRASNLNAAQSVRLQQLVAKFRQRTGGLEPELVVCAPGRVNLIGDHLDYHGFGVLPMAIERTIWLACAFPRATVSEPAGTLTVLNVDEHNFADWTGPQSLKYGASLDTSHKWHHYVLCGYHGVLATKLLGIEAPRVLEHARQLASNAQQLEEADAKLAQALANINDSTDNNIKVNLTMLVDSDLPAAAGLSSSSALVCASALATCLMLERRPANRRHHNAALHARPIAEWCSNFEHLVGTHGGGMDQAVIMTAHSNYAKHVQFVPVLKCEDVHLPQDTVWLVSHCGHSFAKAATSEFNERVLETKLAAALFVSKLTRATPPLTSAAAAAATNLPLDRTLTLGHIRRANESLRSDQIVEQLISAFAELAHKYAQGTSEQSPNITIEQMRGELRLSHEQFVESFGKEVADEQRKFNLIKLRDRCVHVFEEAERVQRFKSICDTTTDIGLLGQLMSQSHNSLRDLYDCSHPALDRLTSVALEAGALGSRLTGAGWGGCVVSLVEASRCETVHERLSEVSKFTFRTEPQSGCCIIDLNEEQ